LTFDVVPKIQVFCERTPCSWVTRLRRLGVRYCFRIQGSESQIRKYLHCLTLEYKHNNPFETPETTLPATQRHAPEDLYPH